MSTAPPVAALRALQASLNSAIDNLVDTLDAHAPAGEVDKRREVVVEEAKAAVAAVVDPATHIGATGFVLAAHMAVRIAIQLDLFAKAEHGVTLAELLASTGAEEVFLTRMMRSLVSDHYFSQDADARFVTTPLGKALVEPKIRDFFLIAFDVLPKAFLQAPEFFAKNGYKSQHSSTPFEFAYGQKIFDYLGSNPGARQTFHTGMHIQQLRPASLRPVFPFAKYLAGLSTAPDAVAIVDVGGGYGQFLDEEALTASPNLPGRLINQDLPATLAGMPARDRIEAMAYDFFTPQPIKGAKYYHLRSILHDWSDVKSREILANLVPALKPGYSRVLLNDMVFPATGSVGWQSRLDLTMMAGLGGLERTEQHWRALLGEAGLRIVEIHWPDVGHKAIIEAALASEPEA